MAVNPLPVEVIDRIVQFVRRSDLPALSRVSKQLQPIAEARMYEEMIMRDPGQASRGCAALSQQDFLRAPYVKRFWLYQDPRLCRPIPWPEQFWRCVQAILEHMVNLEHIYLCDETYANTWIFERPMPFRLRDALLNFQWDEKLVAFLETQDRLRYLCVQTGVDDDTAVVHRAPQLGSLPALAILEAPMHVAFDLLSCKLQRMALVIDDESAPLFGAFVEAFASTNKTMFSLNVVAIPEFLVADSLRVLSASTLATTLRHLGVLSLPLLDRRDIHRSLVKFSRLEVMQVDVSHWTGAPMLPSLQRMVVTELRTYCATLKQFIFWHGTHQTTWRLDGEQWVHQHIPGARYPARDVLWRDC